MVAGTYTELGKAVAGSFAATPGVARGLAPQVCPTLLPAIPPHLSTKLPARNF